jgi:hypothetical protein
LNLSYDRHCNLACPSCRSDLILSNDEVRERQEFLYVMEDARLTDPMVGLGSLAEYLPARRRSQGAAAVA